MTSSSPAPKVPLWIFVLVDIVLLGFAGLIAAQSRRPWSELTIFAVAACVTVGAILLLVPWLMHVERQKNEMLDDRQRALEALARTVTSAAEQISIAASGLHEITEIAQRNLKQAEQLPHRLQEKIAEFQAQLANASETDREELEKELEELRASESERLQSIADKIARTAADLAKLEASSHQHLTAANEAVAKVGTQSAAAWAKAQAATEQALAHGRDETLRAITAAEADALKAIAAARTTAATELATQFEQHLGKFQGGLNQLGALVETLQKAPRASEPAPQPPSPPAAEAQTASTAPEATPAAAAESTPVSEGPVADSTPPAEPPHPPKRPRKRRDEPVHQPASTVEAAPAVAIEPTATETAPTIVSAPVATEPAPVMPEAIPEVAPVAPNTAEPFAVADPVTEPNLPASAEAPVVAAETPTPKPSRKRAAKPVGDDQPALGLDIEEPKENGEGGPGLVERVLTSDGATRLIVTAYIGIGNRLFIRGSGPGLSWDKGVPLQFVSIGKWRWETSDASGPVQFKLFKNDEQESAGLGTLTIDPGHQHEVTANF